MREEPALVAPGTIGVETVEKVNNSNKVYCKY